MLEQRTAGQAGLLEPRLPVHNWRAEEVLATPTIDPRPQGLGKRFGYVRADGDPASLDRQLAALAHAGCDKVFRERAGGPAGRRPALELTLQVLEHGDHLVTWSLDRIARSVPNLLRVVRDLRTRGVGLVTVAEGIDTSEPGGAVFFDHMESVLRVDETLEHERTSAALSAAAQVGRRAGRPSVMTAERLMAASSLLESGHSVTDVASVLGVSRATVRRHLTS